MRKVISIKLAWQTLIHNYRITLPYLFGSSLIAGLIFSMVSLSDSTSALTTFGYNTTQELLNIGTWIVVFFSVIFYFYLQSVLLKSRRQEMGLLSALGLNKRHLIYILFWQMVFLFAANLTLGVLGGFLLDKAMRLLVDLLLQSSLGQGFRFSWIALERTAQTLAVIYVLLFVYSMFSLLRSHPIEMLKAEQQGEREPKNNWLLGLGGIICLGIGYGMAVTITDPVSALVYFFSAVAFVIVGTYLTFMYGSILLLKAMQKNPKYYYQPAHFLSVSNMKYRLKQNAASLASIAILSTSVLVGVSATGMLLLSTDESIDALYPKGVSVTMTGIPGQQVMATQQGLVDGIVSSGQAQGEIQSYSFAAMYGFRDGNAVSYEYEEGAKTTPIYTVFFTEADWNAVTGENLSLEDNQIYAWMEGMDPQQPVLLNGSQFALVRMDEPVDVFLDWDVNAMPGTPIEFVVVKNPQIYTALMDEGYAGVRAFFDMTPALEAKVKKTYQDPTVESPFFALHEDIASAIAANGGADTGAMIATKEAARIDRMNLYSGLFFIGVYLSFLFLFAVVLLMYYKQLTEGIQDKKRFKILQNVGLEEKQIHKVINDQVLQLFFLPLITAAIHVCFAYPMLKAMLSALGGISDASFALLLAAAFAVYTLVYIIMYKISSRTYYSIVRES